MAGAVVHHRRLV